MKIRYTVRNKIHKFKLNFGRRKKIMAIPDSQILKKFIGLSFLSLTLFLMMQLVATRSHSETSSDILAYQLYDEIKVLDSVENSFKEMILSKQYKNNDELFILSSIKQMIRTTQGVLIGQMELISVDKYIDTKHKKEYSEQRFNSINLKKVVLNSNRVELERLSNYISNDKVDILSKKSTKAIKKSLKLLDKANRLYEIEILK